MILPHEAVEGEFEHKVPSIKAPTLVRQIRPYSPSQPNISPQGYPAAKCHRLLTHFFITEIALP